MKKVKIILEQNTDKSINKFSIVKGDCKQGETILGAGSSLFLRCWVNLLLDVVKDNRQTASFYSPNYNNDLAYTPDQADLDFNLLAK